MRRLDRIKWTLACMVCLALHFWRCGWCCGLCPQPAQLIPLPPPAPMLQPEVLLGSLRSETISGSGFRQAGFMIWGSSVIRGSDGSYHMFVSRWDERLGHAAWVTSSHVVHAVSSSPLGPWRFHDVALPRRGSRHWDGMATHNPTIHWNPRRQEYCLFYIGTSYQFAPPFNAPFTNRTEYELAWNSKRIGVATSRSLDGPWRRLLAPILEPRPGFWDGGITSNPAPVIFPNGSVLLIYKSIAVRNTGGIRTNRTASSHGHSRVHSLLLCQIRFLIHLSFPSSFHVAFT